MKRVPVTSPALLTSAEVARMFRVDVQTAGRWRRAGRLSSCVTPGGKSRFSEDEVRALLAQDGQERAR